MSIKSVANVGRSILPIVVGSYAGNYAKGLFGGSEFAGGVGWFLGQAGLNAILPKQKVQQQGSRLSDLSVQSSSYGTTIPLIFGRVKVAGAFIWARPLEEYTKVSTTSDGKGGSGVKTETTEYKYRANFAIYLGEGPNEMVHRIWANGTLIFEDGKYMPTNTTTALNLNGTMPDEGVDIAPNIRLYFGTETQLPDPIIESYEGIGEVPAHRGLTYLRFTDFELEPYGNSMPAFEFELSNYVAVEVPQVDEANTPSIPLGADWSADYDEISGMLVMRAHPYGGWEGMPASIVRQPLYVQRQTDAGLRIDTLELPDLLSTYGLDLRLTAVGGYAYLVFGRYSGTELGSYVAPYYLKIRLSQDGEHAVVSARLPDGQAIGPALSYAEGSLPLFDDAPHTSLTLNKSAHSSISVTTYYDVPGTAVRRSYRPTNRKWNYLKSYETVEGPELTDNGVPFDGFDRYSASNNLFSVPTIVRPVAWTADGDAVGGWIVCQAGIRVDLDNEGDEVRTWVGDLYSFDGAGALKDKQSFDKPSVAIPFERPFPFIDPQRKTLVFMGAVIQLWDL